MSSQNMFVMQWSRHRDSFPSFFFFFFLGFMPSAKPENLVILIMKKKHVLLKTSLLNILSCCFSVTAELLLHFSNVNEFSGLGETCTAFSTAICRPESEKACQSKWINLTLRASQKNPCKASRCRRLHLHLPCWMWINKPIHRGLVYIRLGSHNIWGLTLSCSRTHPPISCHVSVDQVCHIHSCQWMDSPDDTLINKNPSVSQK